jgi:hypothetical protein
MRPLWRAGPPRPGAKPQPCAACDRSCFPCVPAETPNTMAPARSGRALAEPSHCCGFPSPGPFLASRAGLRFNYRARSLLREDDSATTRARSQHGGRASFFASALRRPVSQK